MLLLSWVDGEESRRKIKVAIRPLSPTNAAPVTSNVEDIRASVQGLSLSPTAVVSNFGHRLLVGVVKLLRPLTNNVTDV